MSKISTLIGTISDESPIPHHTTDTGEKFVTVHAKFQDIELDVLVSSFVYTGITGRVQIKGCLCTEKLKGEDGSTTSHFFVLAQDISAVDPATQETVQIEINAKITKNNLFIVTKHGQEVLFLYVTAMNPLGRTDVFKLCLTGEQARRYRNAVPGEYIKGIGTIKRHKSTLEIAMDEIE